MVEIKMDKNASKALDQDPTHGVSCVTFKACDVGKSQPSTSDPTAMT